MIGIIGAMDIEIDGLKAMASDVKTEVFSGIEYTSGHLCGKNVVMAVSGIGKVNAAVCAQTMILKYDLSCIINTGVAGSLTTDLNIGNIAIAKNAVEHDMDTSALGDPIGYISGVNMVKMPADPTLCEMMCRAAEKLGLTYKAGTIASGDQFAGTIHKKAQIANNFDAIACEMEGASIGHVCCINKLPFGIVRAISDSATGKSDMEYQEFKVAAAEMSNKMVAELLNNL